MSIACAYYHHRRLGTGGIGLAPEAPVRIAVHNALGIGLRNVILVFVGNCFPVCNALDVIIGVCLILFLTHELQVASHNFRHLLTVYVVVPCAQGKLTGVDNALGFGLRHVRGCPMLRLGLSESGIRNKNYFYELRNAYVVVGTEGSVRISTYQGLFVNILIRQYNLINPNGLYVYLQEGQQIVATAIIGGESVDVGTLAFTKAEASDDELTATITANDPALGLDGDTYDGGMTGTDTLTNMLTAVLLGTGTTFETSAGNYTVSKAIPVGTVKREAIRLLAQAACCTTWFDRDGVLQVKPLSIAQTAHDSLTADCMPSLGGIRVSEPVGQVVLTVSDSFIAGSEPTTYTAGSGTPIKTVDNPCVAAANGQAVAMWLYNQFNRRVRYEKPNRCNPAIEIGDTLNIADAYGENNNAVVTEINIKYDGGLSAVTKAVGA